MRKIFISYRRAEAEYAAGALGRELRAYFGDAQVFRDKEDIGGGVSWRKQVLAEIDGDSALLVLIGKDWAHARDAQGNRRLERADDPIRLEISDGIKDGSAVIPVLLENADMPSEADLPAEMQPMAEFNALRLRDSDWPHDMGRICKTLEKAGFTPVSPAASSTPANDLQAVSKGRSGKLIASYIIGVLALFGFKETHDADTYWGLSIFGLVALVLAVLAYRDYKKRGVTNRWPVIGAIALGALGALGYTGWALDPNTKSEAAADTPSAAPSPAVRDKSLTNLPPATAGSTLNAMNALAPTPAAESAPPNIAGRWKDEDENTAVVFSQEGNRVHMVATQQGVAVEGNGTLTGRQLRMILTMAGVSFAELHLTLSPNGRAMQGAMRAQGETEQVVFTR